ncbi:hypothetical protein HHL22_03770 [Hymenobacter sp. RP-2-7]|uniref:Uncharacterized protein n=1 Tax=Hymenobacter polaris TaxID=2682546 RepID=A0A7Y0ABH0_9BACT|nr:hypothetical protein [Hymenobacter polaris]NML64316.1 hypothetical protein [Hymenobacter polaris]
MLTRYRPLIPTLILLLACLGTLLNVLVTFPAEDYRYALTAQQYGGLAAVAALLASFFWLRRYYKHVLVACCLLALFSLISFLPGQFSIGLGFDELRFMLSIEGLLLSLLVYGLYRQRANAWLAAAIRPSEQKIAQAYRAEVAEFSARFERKPTEELQQIVAARKLVPAALAAAQQLLRERQSATERP